MSKAFTKEAESPDDEEMEEVAKLPQGFKNYISPDGFARIKSELFHLLDVERPEVTRTVAWAASNGDRSENADYIYGKRRLREIDKRIRFLTKRLDTAEVVDSAGRDTDQVFFGATVTVMDEAGKENTYTIVGVDEIDTSRGRISWISPMAKALLKSRVGDEVTVRTPAGNQEIEVIDIQYNPID